MHWYNTNHLPMSSLQCTPTNGNDAKTGGNANIDMYKNLFKVVLFPDEIQNDILLGRRIVFLSTTLHNERGSF